MVKANSELVSSILGALFTWKTCTVDQLRAGLSIKGAPAFERDEPNLYGAMNRLGIINVGFSQAERLYGQTVNHVWLSPSNSPRLINRAMKLYGWKSGCVRRWRFPITRGIVSMFGITLMRRTRD